MSPMIERGGMYTLRPETAARLRAALPFPVARLHDVEDLGRALTVVEETPLRLLLRFNTGALLDATVRGPEVVALRFYEGEEAVRAWIIHGLVLPGELVRNIRAALVRGAPADAALRQVWGPDLRLLQPLGESPSPAGRVRRYRVQHEAPHRVAALELEVDGHGRITRVELLEGQEAWDVLSARR